MNNNFTLSNSAVISDCLKYRYWLTRSLGSPLRWIKPIVFIMLNPSTADASNDDPTIRRCMSYAKQWGGTDLVVVNLFAFRATDPNELYEATDPIGKLNDFAIKKAIQLAETGLIVCAWGEHGKFRGRAKEVLELMPDQRAFCLKQNKSGQPAHPLYQKKDAELKVLN